MSDPAVNAAAPEITIRVELAPAFHGLGLEARLAEAVSETVVRLLTLLGVPGRPAVQIAPVAEVAPPCRLWINGQRCQHADSFFPRLRASFQRRHETAAQTADWLPAAVTPAERASQAVAFIALACEELIKQRPSLLLAPGAPAAFGEVLDCGLAVADQDKVAAAFAESARLRLAHAETVETLIAALQPGEIEIRLAPGYLRTLTETADPAGKANIFALMRDGLFYELGVLFPAFRLVTDENIPPCSFAFKFNHLTTAPRLGLTPAQALANETPERLRLLGLEPVEEAAHPVSKQALGIIRREDVTAAANSKTITWDALGFLVLCLSAELRARSATLLRQETVSRAVEQLELVFPALIEAVRLRLPVARLTAVLRALLAEEVSVRDLRQILEAILACDYVLTDETNQIVFDERIGCRTVPPPGWRDDPIVLVNYARRALKRYLSHKYTRGQSTLITYLLDPAIERQLVAHASGEAPLADAQRERIIAAARSELASCPPSESPTVLTTSGARRAFRQLIAPIYPSLPVLAYQELSPEMNIQPRARISAAD